MTHAWHFEKDRKIDVICMGRVAVDLYADQIGCSLEDAQSFRKYLGGCAGNIAVGSSRLGLHSAMFSCVGTDAMGNYLLRTLLEEKVDISLVTQTPHHLTGLVLLGINPPDRFPLIFYRENCADMQIKIEDVKIDFIAAAKALLFTGTGLSTDSMRATTHAAVYAARSVQTRVIFDLDYRPVLWGLTQAGDGETRYTISERVSREYHAILPHCDLIVGTEEEIRIAGHHDDIIEALHTIRRSTTAPIVVKQGADGCSIYLDDFNQPIRTRPFHVEVLNVLGAGDAFISGFMRGLLRGADWETCATYGNAGGAIVVTRHGCAPAMPTFTELQTFIDQAHAEEEQLS